MAMPLVSVLLPFRNPGRYLIPAVESILEQTFRDLELIALDDGSTDGSGEALAELVANDPRLRVVSEGGRGLVATLNRGLDLARGALVARMDADDVALPHRLERQVAFLARRPEVVVVGTNYRIITADGPTPRLSALPCEPEEVRAALPRLSPLAHPTVLMRRAPIVALGGYRPQFRDAEDYDLWLRVAERHELANVPDVLFHYRWHGEQAQFARLEQQSLSAIAALECARCRLAGTPDPAERLVGPVTWRFLEELGWDAERTSAELARRHRAAVEALLEEGLPGEARRMAEALRSSLEGGRFVGATARGDCAAAWFKLERRCGRRRAALRHLLRWSLTSPREVLTAALQRALLGRSRR